MWTYVGICEAYWAKGEASATDITSQGMRKMRAKRKQNTEEHSFRLGSVYSVMITFFGPKIFHAVTSLRACAGALPQRGNARQYSQL